MKTITVELSNERAFDDLVNLDCIAYRLYYHMQDQNDPGDQRVVRSQLKTIQRLIVAYENQVYAGSARESLDRYRSIVP
jgi:hypothetical protein